MGIEKFQDTVIPDIRYESLLKVGQAIERYITIIQHKQEEIDQMPAEVVRREVVVDALSKVTDEDVSLADALVGGFAPGDLVDVRKAMVANLVALETIDAILEILKEEQAARDTEIEARLVEGLLNYSHPGLYSQTPSDSAVLMARVMQISILGDETQIVQL